MALRYSVELPLGLLAFVVGLVGNDLAAKAIPFLKGLASAGEIQFPAILVALPSTLLAVLGAALILWSAYRLTAKLG